MKSSLSMLRRISLHKGFGREKTDFQPFTVSDELAQVAKDMQEMRNCYDCLLSAAAATANSAYEFSESLQEMGACLLEKTPVIDDEENGKTLEMLGTLQLELQKHIDSYRSHIIATITNPSESLLNELRTVEDMKRQCDEKRDVYEYMISQLKDKGRSKGGKGEHITSQKLQSAYDEYREEATLCAFRLKSLKQGQSRSLLTQATRHHAAQLNFFRKGLQSLEAVEPYIRLITKQQHIDYQFSGLEEDDYGDCENDNDADQCDELSFDYTLNKQGPDVFSASQNSTGMSLDKKQVDLKVSNKEPRRVSSYSDSIIAGRRFDPAEKARQLLSPTSSKSNTYVLPTPVDIKENTVKTSSSAPRTSASGRSHNLWHSSPLDNEKIEKHFSDGKLSEPTTSRAQSGLKEINTRNTYTQLPRPSTSKEGLSPPRIDAFNFSDTKKIKRQAFSGPLPSKPLSIKPALCVSSLVSTDTASGVLSRLPMPQLSSPKASPSASPPLISSPGVSEVHELPKPPDNQPVRPMKSYQMGHSAPLALRNQGHSATNKFPSLASSAASPLPTPPLVVPRMKLKWMQVANRGTHVVYSDRKFWGLIECPGLLDAVE
ncbi:hypothetical protein K1719_034029 [Acacia pycnantha]|nr:hypothetical protein K1719_034029 [Acacia pycnantha]